MWSQKRLDIIDFPVPMNNPFSTGGSAGINIIVAIRLIKTGQNTSIPPITNVVINLAACTLFLDIRL